MEIFSINNIIGALINSFAQIFIWSRLLNKKINFKSYKYYAVQIIFALLMLVNYILVNDVVRITVLIILMVLLCKFLNDDDYKETTIAVVLSQFIMMISEIIFVLIVTGVFRVNLNNFLQYFVGKIIGNLCISLIAIFISFLKITRVLFSKINNFFEKYHSKTIFLIMTILLLSINFIFLSIYYKYSFVYVFIVNAFISLVYFIICIHMLTTENKYTKINDKYNNTLNSLKEYEDILDVYRVSNHENKNQLLMIRNMITKGDKDIPEYIDKIIDNKIKDDEKLMFDTNKIPAGGLRAVVYSKLLVMKDEKIDFNLIVDRKVRTVDLIELGEDLMLDVCRITGVFLDNAIEEVKDKGNKRIIVELFTDEDELCIKISNNFSNTINIEKIYDKGYTTKTNGHGYGLSLVKEITDKNKKLTNLTSIEKDMFTQLLKIKLK